MIDLQKTVFVVDGMTEIEAIRSKIQKEKGITVRIVKGICNGEDVDPKTYGTLLAPKILPLLSSNCKHIVIILDKEKRKTEISKLKEFIKSEVYKNIKVLDKNISKDAFNESINLIIADIMFENWILSDILSVREKYPNEFKKDVQQICFEGRSGSALLKSLLSKKSYNKVIDGPKYFKAINFNIGKRNSNSFNSFIELFE